MSLSHGWPANKVSHHASSLLMLANFSFARLGVRQATAFDFHVAWQVKAWLKLTSDHASAGQTLTWTCVVCYLFPVEVRSLHIIFPNFPHLSSPHGWQRQVSSNPTSFQNWRLNKPIYTYIQPSILSFDQYSHRGACFLGIRLLRLWFPRDLFSWIPKRAWNMHLPHSRFNSTNKCNLTHHQNDVLHFRSRCSVHGLPLFLLLSPSSVLSHSHPPSLTRK